MSRNKENRIFEKQENVAYEEALSTKFVITLSTKDIKRDINDLTSESTEVKLVQFAKSKYAKELAEKNNSEGFIQYCLDNIYHVTIGDILKSTTKIVDGSWKVEADYLVYMEAILAAGLVVAAEIGALVIAIVAGDEPGEEPGPSNIASAAAVCGGKEFGKNVVHKYCELLRTESEKRWAY